MRKKAGVAEQPTLANSFSLAEVELFLRLHGSVLRGGHEASAIASDPRLLNLVRKFVAMRDRHRAWKTAQLEQVPR